MKRTLAAILITLLVFTAPAFAQEATDEAPVVTETPAPEQPPVEQPLPGSEFTARETAILVALTIVGLIATVFGAFLVQMARDAKDTLPRWMVEAIRAGAPGALDMLDRLTNVPGEEDDRQRAKLRKMVEEILAENPAPSLRVPPKLN